MGDGEAEELRIGEGELEDGQEDGDTAQPHVRSAEEEAEHQKEMSVVKNKLQRAGLKAAHTYELARAFDTTGFRDKLEGFIHIQPSERTESMIEDFVKLTTSKGRFKFFNTYTEQQQRELAAVVVGRACHRDDVLFKQEDPPDALYLVLNGRCGIYKIQGDVKKLVAVSGTGDSVGDLTHLDERGRRSCTAQITADKAVLMMFRREDLDVLAVQWRVSEETAKTEFITEKVPVLNSVPREILANLSPYFEKVRMAKDTVVYRQQDDANIIYFIWEGEVQLIKRIDLIKVPKKNLTNKIGQGVGRTESFEIPSGPKKISKSLQVGVLRPGEFFGEVEVFNETQRASAVVTTADCTLLALSKNWLESMPPTFLDAIYRYSYQRIQWRNSRIHLLLDCLHNINWVPERDAKLSLEPEIKTLSKMKTALLPMATQPGSDRKGWLGAHTVMSEEDAREWGMYYYGPWARPPDKVEHRGMKEEAARAEREEEGEEGEDGAFRPHSSPSAKRKGELIGSSFFSQGLGKSVEDRRFRTSSNA